ncbi:hypothetical protein Fcan01_20887 [Folsomia candida]|uniref:F-box domain-containing protein n=1 Tax=Folsomia candida TaxID=158441 RepID=A0A226DGJ9_FOLCA|nr:hypothetical protein Fcan01_20887 [Folsomia candida]
MLQFSELRVKLPKIIDPTDDEYVWDRYAVLENVEGQKYTLGDTSSESKPDGKFLFWCDPGRPKVSLCEIISKDGNFWITPFEEIPLYLNNVESKETTKLQHGDELSLQIVEEGHVGSLKFTTPKLYWDHSELDFNGVFTPGQNPLILSQIFSYLNLHELKLARLVAPEWNQEAIRHIKKQAVVNFHLWHRQDSLKPISLDQFSRYTREMENFPPLENWSITFPESEVNNAEVRAQLVTELDQVLGQSPQIKKLKLADLTKLEVFSVAITILPSIWLPPDVVPTTWLRPLISAMKSLRALHLKCPSVPIAVTLLKNLHNFPHLEEIEFRHITQKGLELLIQGLNKPLKKLVLGKQLNIDGGSMILNYQELLERHCKTLERLEFTVPDTTIGPRRLAMPVFPKLKVLQRSWYPTEINSSNVSYSV